MYLISMVTSSANGSAAAHCILLAIARVEYPNVTMLDLLVEEWKN